LGAAELTFMFSVNPQYFGHDKVVELFQKALPQVRVELVHTPQQYEQKWDSMMAAGTPAEVTQINDDFVPSHGRKGLIRALDSYATRDKLKRSDFYDLFWSFPAADGKWFAPAVGFRPSLLYVNVDLFQKSGVALPAQDKWDVPGWTWDDFLAAARKLTADTATATARSTSGAPACITTRSSSRCGRGTTAGRGGGPTTRSASAWLSPRQPRRWSG